MTPDELKSMPKGQFVVMKTGFYPMKVRLKLFFRWGISFDEEHPYVLPENGNRTIYYASKAELHAAILAKYPPKQLTDGGYPAPVPSGYGGQTHTPQRINKTFRESRRVRTEVPQQAP